MQNSTITLIIERVKTCETCSVTITMDDFANRPDEAIEDALPLSWKLKRLPPSWENLGMSLEDALQRTRPSSFVAGDSPTGDP